MTSQHVRGCARRAAVVAGVHDGEARVDAERRLAAVRCTCRDALRSALVPLLAPYVGRVLTPEMLEAMRATVRQYVMTYERRNGPMAWDVSLAVAEDKAGVLVHLVPPDEIDEGDGPAVTEILAAAAADADADDEDAVDGAEDAN